VAPVEDGADAVAVGRAKVHALGYVGEGPALHGAAVLGVAAPVVDAAAPFEHLFRHGGCVVLPVDDGAVACSVGWW